jgi:assimilatory nitrate reductase catalytic subunit
MLDEHGGIQWPYPADTACDAPQRRLFEARRFYHPDGKARFVWEEPRPMPEAPDGQYPFVLLTGRGSAAQWHTQTRTSKSAVLKKLYPAEIYVEINPRDASKLKIRPGDRVTVASQRGSLQANAVIVHTVPSGHIFVPMHYATANVLTDAVFDPYSFQPAYKACAARIERRAHGDA